MSIGSSHLFPTVKLGEGVTWKTGGSRPKLIFQKDYKEIDEMLLLVIVLQ